jgi:TM2 domain-containing membrane protein YozV
MCLGKTHFFSQMDMENTKANTSEKKYLTAVILSGIFGIMGIHHFYVGRWAMGVLDLGLFLGTLITYLSGNFLIAGLLFFADLVHTVYVTYLLLVGEYRDGRGKLITYPGQII